MVTEATKQDWYPPGHGNFYTAFSDSGLLDWFLAEAKQLCFISNMDNVGATVDLDILHQCLAASQEFVMEVTEKTRADVKAGIQIFLWRADIFHTTRVQLKYFSSCLQGGTLIQYEGKLRLLEVAQVAQERLEDFMSVKKFNVFNTNNLWISLPAIRRVVSRDILDMEVT